MPAQVEHFRHAKILAGDQLIGEEIEGNLAHRAKPNGRVEWFGYFEISDQARLMTDAHYTLLLQDGRSAEIHATEIGNAPASKAGLHAVVYYVTGPIRGVAGQAGKKYGLDKGQRYLG
jgi:hypothetical protein